MSRVDEFVAAWVSGKDYMEGTEYTYLHQIWDFFGVTKAPKEVLLNCPMCSGIPRLSSGRQATVSCCVISTQFFANSNVAIAEWNNLVTSIKEARKEWK